MLSILYISNFDFLFLNGRSLIFLYIPCVCQRRWHILYMIVYRSVRAKIIYVLDDPVLNCRTETSVQEWSFKSRCLTCLIFIDTHGRCYIAVPQILPLRVLCRMLHHVSVNMSIYSLCLDFSKTRIVKLSNI